MSNVRFTVLEPDLRPAVVLDNVTDAAIHALSAQGNPAAESVLRFTRVKDALLTASRVLTEAAAFLRIEGDGNSNVIIEGGDLTKAASPLALHAGANKTAVEVRR